MDTILFFQSTFRKSWRQKLNGVLLYAREKHWFVQVISKNTTSHEITQTIQEWNPIGCLIDRALSSGAPPDRIFKDIPTVYLDQDPSRPSRLHPCLMHDSGKTASAALSVLLARACRSYAYIGTGTNAYWDRERLAQFKKEVSASGAPMAILPTIGLKNALVSLPKPCGVLGANDESAIKVFHAAQSAGLAIPDDVMLIGIDNDELYCESVTPGLTSVEPDFEGAGYRLAEMLGEEIARTKAGFTRRMHEKPPLEKYGPLHTVHRGSTASSRGISPLVRKALEYIRRHACDENICLDHIIAEMNCSRRHATQLFKKETKRTILEEIHRQRFQKACDLLSRTNLPIPFIISECGYKTDSFLRKLFLRQTGLSLRDYRAHHRQS